MKKENKIKNNVLFRCHHKLITASMPNWEQNEQFFEGIVSYYLLLLMSPFILPLPRLIISSPYHGLHFVSGILKLLFNESSLGISMSWIQDHTAYIWMGKENES